MSAEIDAMTNVMEQKALAFAPSKEDSGSLFDSLIDAVFSIHNVLHPFEEALDRQTILRPLKEKRKDAFVKIAQNLNIRYAARF